jgi:hypothetical protein
VIVIKSISQDFNQRLDKCRRKEAKDLLFILYSVDHRPRHDQAGLRKDGEDYSLMHILSLPALIDLFKVYSELFIEAVKMAALTLGEADAIFKCNSYKPNGLFWRHRVS